MSPMEHATPQPVSRRTEQYLSDHPELLGWGNAVEAVLAQIRTSSSPVCADVLILNMSSIMTGLPWVAGTHDGLQDVTGEIETIDVRFSWTRFGTTIGMGFEIRRRSFCLWSELVRPAQLWRAPSEFWGHMSSLARFCDSVEYEPCAVAPDASDRLAARQLQGSKCAVFRMIADYTLLKAQEATPEPECGNVVMHWSWCTKVEPLLEGMAECFARLSRMNWLLYRLNYVDEHARRTKANR